jgi:hypothetical protein
MANGGAISNDMMTKQLLAMDNEAIQKVITDLKQQLKDRYKQVIK